MLIAKMFILLARPGANLYNKTAMNRYSRLPAFIFLFIVLIKTDGSAENSPGGADVFSDIKVRMISSSQENKKLAVENKALKAELVGLQLEIEQYEQEIGRLDPGYMKAKEAARRQKKRPAGRSDPRGDDLIREARNIYLSGRSMALDDVQRLREVQLYDLQYQKQELELDLKSLEFARQKIREQRRPELDALERDIQANITKIRGLSVKIAGQEKAALNYPGRIDLLRMENKALKQRIRQLKRLLK